MELAFEAAHTHLFPGHRGRVKGAETVSAALAGSNCVIEFTDGAAPLGSLSITPDGEWMLAVDRYRTRAGTGIAAARWTLALRESDGEIGFRILRKLPADTANDGNAAAI